MTDKTIPENETLNEEVIEDVGREDDSGSEEVNMEDDDGGDQDEVMKNLGAMLRNSMMGGDDDEEDDDEDEDDDDEDEDEDGDYEDEDDDYGDDDDGDGDNELDIQELLLQYFENEERENIPTVLTSVKYAIDNNSKCILKLVSEVRKMREESQKSRKPRR